MKGSRLDTVQRVAALRERVARATVAAASAARDSSEQTRDSLAGGLAHTSVPGGTAGEVRGQLDGTARLARSVTDAGRDLRLCEQQRQDALTSWSLAARRAQTLADICARQRADHEAATELRSQHMLDDLASGKGRKTA